MSKIKFKPTLFVFEVNTQQGFLVDIKNIIYAGYQKSNRSIVWKESQKREDFVLPEEILNYVDSNESAGYFSITFWNLKKHSIL